MLTDVKCLCFFFFEIGFRFVGALDQNHLASANIACKVKNWDAKDNRNGLVFDSLELVDQFLNIHILFLSILRSAVQNSYKVLTISLESELSISAGLIASMRPRAIIPRSIFAGTVFTVRL